MEMVELIEKIRVRANIQEITSAIDCNRINSFMQHEERFFSKENVVQETSHLRKLLKIPDLSKDMVLTFCAEKEKFHQVLFISHSKMSKIKTVKTINEKQNMNLLENLALKRQDIEFFNVFKQNVKKAVNQ